jgi:hypothetical protein
MVGQRTYRVQGIPATYTKEDSRKVLNLVFESSSDKPRPTVHSLAPDPSSSAGGDGFQIATVTFEQTPKLFQDGKAQWPIPTSRITHSGIRSTIAPITIDSHFVGFTPLNTTPSDSAPGIE